MEGAHGVSIRLAVLALAAVQDQRDVRVHRVQEGAPELAVHVLGEDVVLVKVRLGHSQPKNGVERSDCAAVTEQELDLFGLVVRGLVAFDELVQAVQGVSDQVALFEGVHGAAFTVAAVVLDVLAVLDQAQPARVKVLTPDRVGAVNHVLVLTHFECVVERVL